MIDPGQAPRSACPFLFFEASWHLGIMGSGHEGIVLLRQRRNLVM
jgi:hypothetical protein